MSVSALNQLSSQQRDFWKRKIMHACKFQDCDGDGIMTRRDFKIMGDRFWAMGATKESFDAYYKKFEAMCAEWGLTDDSGLTYEDMANKHIALVEKVGKIDPFFPEAFEIIDTNRDGSISLKEWENFYVALGIDIKHAPASFQDMDTDGDGTVSKEEFRSYNMDYFCSPKNNLLFGPLE